MRNFKVAIYGTAASYHDLAAQKFYGEEIEIVECNTFRQTCETLQSNRADYAVLAVENSLAGSILANYTLMEEYKLRIIGEQCVSVNFNLITLNETKLSDIEFIHSHPMAFAQCSKFLLSMAHAKIIEQGDTSSCVKNIKQNNLKNTAAIAGDLAAQHHNMKVLKSNIQNPGVNYTRFMVLSKGDSIPYNPDKASICFKLRDKPGALSDVLAVMKKNKVNISKIQSVPDLKNTNEYVFHTDVEWDLYTDYEKAIKKIKKVTTNFSVLGEYVKSKNEL
jgi:prephenate dehydratase